jgi:hypothetical protein
MNHKSLCRLCVAALLSIRSVECLSAAGPTTTTTHRHQHRLASTPPPTSVVRRSILERASSGCFGLVVASAPIFVGIVRADVADAAIVGTVDAQFAEVGRQETPPDGEMPFATLSDGVQVKDFRSGERGGPAVASGSRVELTLKGRLLNLNGVVFYDTKSNDPNGFGEGTPLTFVVGDKTVLPGLESGIVGMTRGGIRRIIVPANVGYGAFPGLEPRPFSEMERRALDSVIKNPRRDQTVMFDVKVERVR